MDEFLAEDCRELVNRTTFLFILVTVARDLGYNVLCQEVSRVSFKELKRFLSGTYINNMLNDSLDGVWLFRQHLVQSAMALSGEREWICETIRESLAQSPRMKAMYTKVADILFGGQECPEQKWWKRVGKLANTK